MALSDKSLLPPRSELQKLSDEKVKALVSLADNQSRRSYAYLTMGMVCGTGSFLGSLGAYVYLVMQNHDKAAGVVLGATVLGIIGRMIRGRES